MRSTGATLGLLWLAGLAGCGSGTPVSFANQLIGADGRPLILDDVEAIINESDLSEDEKRTRLRELGLEDEKLIDVLLTL